MSYLLDALRRSERERRHAEMPAAARLRMDLDRPPPTASRWRVVLPALLGLNLAWAFWWWLQPSVGAPEAPARVPAPASAPAPASVPAPADAPARMLAPALEPASAPVRAPDAAPPPPLDAPPQASPDAAPRWPLLRDLSAAERASWPRLEISAQVYSPTNARARFVLVNGAFLREGDALDDGTRVVEILEDAVLFERSGRRARALVVDPEL